MRSGDGPWKDVVRKRGTSRGLVVHLISGLFACCEGEEWVFFFPIRFVRLRSSNKYPGKNFSTRTVLLCANTITNISTMYLWLLLAAVTIGSTGIVVLPIAHTQKSCHQLAIFLDEAEDLLRPSIDAHRFDSGIKMFIILQPGRLAGAWIGYLERLRRSVNLTYLCGLLQFSVCLVTWLSVCNHYTCALGTQL